MANIFISYAREDEPAARRLARDLSRIKHEVWFDKQALAPGRKWQSAIEEAIRASQFFVALLSPRSLEKRGYVQKELRLALDVLQEVPDSETFLIPARIAECEPKHPQLRELQWVDLFPVWRDGVRKIRNVVGFVPAALRERNIANTVWEYDDNEEPPTLLKFHSGGTLSSVYSGEAWGHPNGTWRQAGDVIYFDVNKKYAQYRGLITGDLMRGDAQNVRGNKWQWRAKRRS